MIKKLTPIGNSLGIVIEKPILELLKIDRDTELEITTDGESLTLRRANRQPSRKVKAEAEKIFKKHARTFGKLAK